MHIPTLIQDLALILCTAAITTLLFKWLKQPVVLGYIIAGLLVGPNFSILPTIGDIEGIRIWAELGVIFLLFSLGLEFSFKKLVSVGGNSAVTGVFEITFMMGLGYLVGTMLGWPTMDCFFLAGITAISSTTIIIRAFDELKVRNRKFAGAVLGVLVIEDLVAVLLLVLLSTIAVQNEIEGWELLLAFLKLLFFLSLWFLAGIFLLPSLLKAAKKLMSDENVLILSLALCFLMVILATKVGFSAPLGAFIMGSILAETTQAERIEHLISSVKTLFGAIFFVSVGMLIDPNLLVEYALPVLLLTITVIFGKTLFVTLGSLLSGQPLKQSIQSGMSLSQIGEFSFIIASLGVSLGVTSGYLYPIAVGVSVITTFTTPYLIRAADPFSAFVERALPEKWRLNLSRYSSGAQTIQAENEWKIVLRSYLVLIGTNSVIIIALILLGSNFLSGFIASQVENTVAGLIITTVITLAAMAPFIWALTIKKIHKVAYTSLWLDKKYNRGPLVTLEVLRNLLAVVYLYVLLDQLFPPAVAFVVALVVLIVVLAIFSKRLQTFYDRIESRFLYNLNVRNVIEGTDEKNNISPWDAHLAYFVINPDAEFIGRRLDELKWREKYGINIATIERGNRIIDVPERHQMLFPHDKIAVIGTDEQLQTFRFIIEPVMEVQEFHPVKKDVSLHKIIVDNHNKLRGKSIRNSGIREKTGGLVVGIERDGKRILNPDSDMVLKWDDVLWIVGDWKQIKQLKAD
ncbi:cation:proton antiporter [Aridibaculum aurantiacum]|uniref:cation:proton antiporter domain-containing protein n=1 Tax=Aridibaculum aurantiacum TaxID=2810307 RepID=UPI001A95D9E0|nr:cation:proton antiporter [Aridibaculum aurantiacum]